MTTACREPLGESTLIDYWAGDVDAGNDLNRIEEHLFACRYCSARLAQLDALGNGVASLARQGRISGVISRALLNRLQRDGIHVRMFSLAPGETVPCAIFPGDDLVVTSLRADFSGVDAVSLSVTRPGDETFVRYDEVPVTGSLGEVLWATPVAIVHELPSIRLELTLTSSGAAPIELGHYVLEHSATPPL